MEKKEISFEETFKKWLSSGNGISYNEHIENVKFIRNKYREELKNNNTLSNDSRNEIKQLIAEFDKELVEQLKK